MTGTALAQMRRDPGMTIAQFCARVGCGREPYRRWRCRTTTIDFRAFPLVHALEAEWMAMQARRSRRVDLTPAEGWLEKFP